VVKNGKTFLSTSPFFFLLEKPEKAPQPPVESTLLRQEDVETLVGLIRDIRYDLSMQVRPNASYGAINNDDDDSDNNDDDGGNVPEVLPSMHRITFQKLTTIDTSNKRQMTQ